MSSATPPGSQRFPVGIDLGTTYSVIAYLDADGRPVTIQNSAGDLLTPSAIAVDDDEIIVGKEAIKASLLAPERFADCFKRDMGRPEYRRAMMGRHVPPEALSAFVLRRLKTDAEQRLGPIQQVVITVPAFFDETRRHATEDAGRLAGLEVLDIINEPTAAAVAFGYHDARTKGAGSSAATERVLVYDLGGGTFDVTVLQIEGSTFRTLATDGDVQLGGKDFDERLVNHIAERFLAAHGVDPRSDPQDAMRLWIEAQEAKHALTERTKTTVACTHAGIRFRLEISRREFEEFTRDLLERTEVTTTMVRRQAGLEWLDIQRVLLVGGSSRMPMVSEMLRRVSRLEPDRSQSADEVVAHGAALYAGMLLQEGGSPKIRSFDLINVNSHSLGVVGKDPHTGQKINVVLIPKNTPLPHRAVKRFRTARAHQTTVRVAVVEGESQRPENCIALGECIVRDLPPGLPLGSVVEVEYRYAANGRISVVARLPSVRESASIEIHRERPARLNELEYYRYLLCGREVELLMPGFAPASEANGPGDGDDASIMRLDDLCLKLGTHAIHSTLPSSLEKSKQAALAAADELRASKSALEAAEQLLVRTTKSHADHVVRAAQQSQARLRLERAERNAQFALLVLGRDCFKAKCWPDSWKETAQEMEQLARQMAARATR